MKSFYLSNDCLYHNRFEIGCPVCDLQQEKQTQEEDEQQFTLLQMRNEQEVNNE